MDYRFTRSLVVMGKLAREAARTPPPEEDSPFEYIDQSLTILGRTFDRHDQKIQQEFLGQREFIASQFKTVDERFKQVDERFKQVDERFKEMEQKMDRRFNEVDERFKEIDRRFDKQDSEIRDIRVQLENAAAITRNGRLRRMHQPINLIKILKPAGGPNKFVWASHPQVPKHMKNIYLLGQRAKGVFEPSWEGKQNEQSMYLIARYFIDAKMSFVPFANSNVCHVFIFFSFAKNNTPPAT